ncbi:MAG: helix-turn-helix domain-containing protein [Tannerellaceae bacterium]
MTSIATKQVLTFDEASIFTGLSKSYLYKLTSTQKIPHYKPSGKLCYFDRTELEGWIKQNRVCTIGEIEQRADNYLANGRA